MKSSSIRHAFSLFRVTSSNAWKALFILMAGLALTGLSAYYTHKGADSKEKKEFGMVCNEIKTRVSTRLYSHALLLRTGASYFSASDTVTRRDWQIFIERIKLNRNLPGIQGVGFSIVIPAENLQQHIQDIRREGFSDYSIRPAGDRDTYTSILYIEPFSGRNLRAFGYDMFSEPVRRKAMEQSRDADLAMLSGKVILKQETNKDVQFGALMYVPVYKSGMLINTQEQRRAAIRGWVYSPYRMNDLMQGILGRWDLARSERIHLQVYEDSISEPKLLYDSQIVGSTSDIDLPSRTVSLPVEFGGKRWILHFTKSLEQSAVSSNVLIILGTGFSISLLLMVLSLSLFNTLGKARQIAGQLTLDLTESEERFKLLLNTTAEAIYGIDLQGNCTFSNASCQRMLGISDQRQILGMNMHNLIHHTHADGRRFEERDCRIHSSSIGNEGVHVADEILWRLDGTSFPAEYWSYPIFVNGKTEGAVVTFFDITERRMSDEIIVKAMLDAEKANQAKSEFLSRMSHELRTPLNAILGFAQLLEMSELNPKQMKGIGHILHSGKHLLNMINEVLDISRIESGQLELSIEPVQANMVIKELIELLQPMASARQIKIHMEIPPDTPVIIMTDPQLFTQVVLNLLNNAIKYNRIGGSVIIKMETMPASDQGLAPVRISFTDTGYGISKENILKLFIPFERVGAEKSTIEGTGLGLAVVSKIMNAMGALIGVDSNPGEGTTFWIEFPQNESNPHAFSTDNTLALQKIQEAGNIGSVLYIEDNSAGIELVKTIFADQRENIRLLTSLSGRQALPLAMEYLPDLILLDIDLPDISGLEVIESLNSEEKTKSIPVIIISADATPEQIDTLLKAGAKYYLTKPLELTVFLKLVDEYVVC